MEIYLPVTGGMDEIEVKDIYRGAGPSGIKGVQRYFERTQKTRGTHLTFFEIESSAL